jgi:hypothetical protein
MEAHNVRVVSVWMASVATALVREPVKRAPRRKKEAVQMAHVAISLPRRIPTMNAQTTIVMVPERARKRPLARHVRRTHNAVQAIARMGIAAIRRAQQPVWLVTWSVRKEPASMFHLDKLIPMALRRAPMFATGKASAI